MTVISASSVSFQTLARGQYSGVEDALTEVYRTRQDFEALWQQHGSKSSPAPAVPDVDFATQTVAVVFMGARNSGGFDIEVTSVDRKVDGSGLVVNFMTSNPPPDSMVTMAFTQPYHMVRLDSSEEGVVTFEGSVKPLPPPKFPRYIIGVAEGADADELVAAIEAHPTIKNVELQGTRSKWLFVDFDSENTDKDEARNFLEALEGATYVEEDSTMI